MKATLEQKKKKEFGKLIRTIRKFFGMTQDEFANFLEVSRTTITNYESGTNVPKLDVIFKLSERATSYLHDALIKGYIRVHHDKNDLLYLARKYYSNKPIIAKWCLKEAFRVAITQEDIYTAVSVVFQVIFWDLEIGRKVNWRKIKFIIQVFATLDPDKFADLLENLYQFSFKHNKQFDAFVKIMEQVIEHLRLEERKSFVLRYRYANALYYQGSLLKAFESTTEALKHNLKTVDQYILSQVYSRHGLICMQLKGGHQEALTAFKKCLDLQNPELEKFCYHNTARVYYMMGKYEEAIKYWDKMFEATTEDDLLRINALNDICMMMIITNNFDAARDCVPKITRLFELANKEEWSMYDAESLLFERNLAFLDLQENNREGIIKITKVLEKLKESYMQDEFDQTKNLLVEFITLSVKL